MKQCYMTVVEMALRIRSIMSSHDFEATSNVAIGFMLEYPAIPRSPSNPNHADSTEVTETFKSVKQLASSTARSPVSHYLVNSSRIRASAL